MRGGVSTATQLPPLPPLPAGVTGTTDADGTLRYFYRGELICVDRPLSFTVEPFEGGERLTVTWVIERIATGGKS